MPTKDRQLSTKDERRIELVRAAVHTFAECGYYGTSTTEIAALAGISQAYVYRLYPNKEALFVAVLQDVKTRMRQMIREAAEGSVHADSPRDTLRAAAKTILQDHDMAMVLLHANAAASEPGIRLAVLECYRDQVEFLRETFGASDEDIQWFVAVGQLANSIRALRVDPEQDAWTDVLLWDLA